MAKTVWKPSTLLNPVPVVMVSCAYREQKSNIITLAWVGTVNSDPPMISISVRPERHSYEMIKNSKEFVVNLVGEKLVKAADFCGVKSGRDIDKFLKLGLTAGKASAVSAPLIQESPVNVECKVVNMLKLGSHDMFIGEVLAVNIDEDLINSKGKLELEKAKLAVFSHGEYWGLKNPLGFFGFSIAKENTLRRKTKSK